jgi:hypothetical protein
MIISQTEEKKSYQHNASSFKVCKVEKALPLNICNFLNNYALKKADLSQCYAYTPKLEKSFGEYSAAPMELLLMSMLPIIEKAVGRELVATYSYFRVYFNGAELKAHRDRVACEYSATLHLGNDGSSLWPIYFEQANSSFEGYLQNVGDLIIYKGIQQTHYREIFKGIWHTQVFLHYIDKNGEYAKIWKNDKRRNLASPKIEF